MKKPILFFLALLLSAALLTLSASAAVSDSLHIPAEELQEITTEQSGTVIELYNPNITMLYMIVNGTHWREFTDRSWMMLVNDTGVWDVTDSEGTNTAPVELSDYYTDRCRILAEYVLNPLPLFEGIEKNADFAILETYCFHLRPRVDAPPFSPPPFILFITTQGDYVYYNPLYSHSPTESNGYLFPYEIFPEVVAASIYDQQTFHLLEDGGTYPFDQIYDLSSYRVHGDMTVSLHHHEPPTQPPATNPAPAPSTPNEQPDKAFPYELFIGISLGILAVGGIVVATIIILKKRKKT